MRPLTRSLQSPAMSVGLGFHAFSGNPLKNQSPKSIASTLDSHLEVLSLDTAHGHLSSNFKVLPFRKGRPLTVSSSSSAADSAPVWHLAWLSLAELKSLFFSSGVPLSSNSLVYLGCDKRNESYCAVNVSRLGDSAMLELDIGKRSCFVELRTLMVATDWANEEAMKELAIAGYARAFLEWHNASLFCGYCGMETTPADSGRRKKCKNDGCGKSVFPRVDPVVIMLVIDKEKDRALLSRQSRFAPRMWSCLAGFVEPGESLEEAVRRETLEETGIEVGEVVYHSSQPWPVGPNNLPCQMMIGFLAFAKTFDIHLDMEELEDARWHTREEIKRAFISVEYEKVQRIAAEKVGQICKGIEKRQSLSLDYNVEGGEMAQMFVPGPFAIAHHLISSWVNDGASDDNTSL